MKLEKFIEIVDSIKAVNKLYHELYKLIHLPPESLEKFWIVQRLLLEVIYEKDAINFVFEEWINGKFPEWEEGRKRFKIKTVEELWEHMELHRIKT